MNCDEIKSELSNEIANYVDIIEKLPIKLKSSSTT